LSGQLAGVVAGRRQYSVCGGSVWYHGGLEGASSSDIASKEPAHSSVINVRSAPWKHRNTERTRCAASRAKIRAILLGINGTSWRTKRLLELSEWVALALQRATASLDGAEWTSGRQSRLTSGWSASCGRGRSSRRSLGCWWRRLSSWVARGRECWGLGSRFASGDLAWSARGTETGSLCRTQSRNVGRLLRWRSGRWAQGRRSYARIVLPNASRRQVCALGFRERAL